MNVRRSFSDLRLDLLGMESLPSPAREILDEETFHRMICLERKRTERSHKPFLLMLLDMGEEIGVEDGQIVLRGILDVLSAATRETDEVGWHKNGFAVGVMFTEIEVEQKKNILNIMLARLSAALQNALSLEQFSQLSISFHWFPEEWSDRNQKKASNSLFYSDLEQSDNSKYLFSAVKRCMDVVGSLIALACLSPLFLAIAIAIKLTAKGPVFFRQQRIGRFGKSFTFLKFRSMYIGNDPSIHREYVKHLIAGTAERQPTNGNGAGHYKLTNDPRITTVGAFLRKTSLDELPQFINVLKGDMSLVGPRPPIPYEVESYDVWHRRRVLEVKPGITGLWQVSGRSRIKFDDMVRLDLQYARTWSPWMDLKILLRTPGAVVLGEGAC